MPGSVALIGSTKFLGSHFFVVHQHLYFTSKNEFRMTILRNNYGAGKQKFIICKPHSPPIAEDIWECFHIFVATQSKLWMWQLNWDMFLKTEHAVELQNSLFPCQQRTADISFYYYCKELHMALAYNTLCCFFSLPPAFAMTTFLPGSKQQYTQKMGKAQRCICVFI